MSLITLKDIGKIYVSGTNVAVGIRGVNLSFDRGEFVAVTGKSGSGKSTLLNIISGMDSYEEGEMLIEGEPTSHYVQQDWEEYREKYISFIFQDYNIIESFTVLQNVELALLHIKNPEERRKTAVSLLTRVGLERHLNHKGSRLSGGQKQRTVIARALAKDSPVILADEPTGNLDSQSSKEIIELLREVSREKLVIIVTHNFEQVADYATRHIRVFDGAIEANEEVTPAAAQPGQDNNTAPKGAKADAPQKTARDRRIKSMRDGLTLGSVRFKATPKLSVFLCILMILSSLAMTLVTSLSGSALGLFDKKYIFAHENGRVIVIRQDGAVITDDELKQLAETTNAGSYMHYDFLLDATEELYINNNTYYFGFGYDRFGSIDAGRAPENESEVFLRVPVSLKTYFGDKKSFKEVMLSSVFGMADYRVVGIDYYYDNTKLPEMIFTQKGYEIASSLAYLDNQSSGFRVDMMLQDEPETIGTYKQSCESSGIHVSFDIGDKSYYINSESIADAMKDYENIKQSGEIPGYDYTVTAQLIGSFTSYNYTGNAPKRNDYSTGISMGYEVMTNPSYGTISQSVSSLDEYTRLSQVDSSVAAGMSFNGWTVLLSPDIINDIMKNQYYAKAYTQASLFYKNDISAEKKTDELQELGYTAVASTAVDKGNGGDAILSTILLMGDAISWIIAVVFITLFISLCSTRAMLATKGDIAILRSMGVSTTTVKISIYVQTLISLIPAYAVTAITAFVIFTIPQTNALFGFLQPWEYVVIAVALLAITILLSKSYTKKMFRSSVKKTLKGEAQA